MKTREERLAETSDVFESAAEYFLSQLPERLVPRGEKVVAYFRNHWEGKVHSDLLVDLMTQAVKLADPEDIKNLLRKQVNSEVILLHNTPTFLEYLREWYLLPTNSEYQARPTPDTVRGKHVIGMEVNLELAAAASKVTIIKFTPPEGFDPRKADLSTLRQYLSRPETYVVGEVKNPEYREKAS